MVIVFIKSAAFTTQTQFTIVTSLLNRSMSITIINGRLNYAIKSITTDILQNLYPKYGNISNVYTMDDGYVLQDCHVLYNERLLKGLAKVEVWHTTVFEQLWEPVLSHFNIAINSFRDTLFL